MATASRARNSEELPAAPRPNYASHPFARNSHSISNEGARLIYFDHNRATELLEHIASSAAGRAAISKFAGTPSADLAQQRDQRAVLSRLIAEAEDLKDEGIVDLHYPTGSSRRVHWSSVHPDQVIAVKGSVTSAKDIQPSSLRLEVEGKTVRAFVDRDHFLHLNQSYLATRAITVVGKVRSVPQAELLAAAVGIEAHSMISS
jgi:hypothetical protein